MQWTRLAYNSDPAEAFGDFAGLDPWRPGRARAALPAGVQSALSGRSAERQYAARGSPPAVPGAEVDALRAEIRRVVIEELRATDRG